MLSRRRFVLGVAAAALPLQAARANVPAPYDWDASPPTSSREAFVAWMVKNRGEDANFLGQRYDRYLKLVAGKDLWEAPTTRAYLMTPREEFVTHDNLARAYEGHFLNIGFGVTITGPHSVCRMTNTLEIKRSDKVLEIGTGSGYQSAVLSNLTPNVFSIEIIAAARPAHPRALRFADRARLFRICGDHDQERRRLLRLGGAGAVRQDHRHLRHRPRSAAAVAADEARRDHGHSRSARPGRSTC